MKADSSKLSDRECAALVLLSNEGYTDGELALMFECKDETVARHRNAECQHHEPEGYSDSELLDAYRRVKELCPHERMSRSDYERYRPQSYPTVSTITARFGWRDLR